EPDPLSRTSLQAEPLSPAETSDSRLCRMFSDIPWEMEDVDAKDSDNPQLCSEYVKDIYKYLRELEAKRAVRPQYLSGQDITGNMRATLIDWLVQVQMKFKLFQETLYLTVTIIDRFLQDNTVSKQMLQLVGITAMFIASKYEETFNPNIDEFAFITDAYTKAQIREMEVKILQALDFGLACPLSLHFLRRASRIAKVDVEQHILAKYLLELSILDYDMVHFPPSMTAAAASCLAMKILSGNNWTSALQYYMSYSESDLLPAMQHLAKNLLLVNKGLMKHVTIKKKYASHKHHCISTHAQLNSPVLEHLAQPLA
ncbi:CCNB1 protein, partial [Penelope pileata]|nr:CCNB1 protein [Penelope pileata]